MVDISGATSSAYTLVPADIGFNISCRVTATNIVSSANATSNVLGPVTAGNVAPSNSIPPVISGTTVSGNTLTVTSDGTWVGSPTPTFAYQWKRSPGEINIGTNSTSYSLVPADVGLYIRCDVTATNSAGSATASSNDKGPITAPSAFTPTYFMYFF